MKELLYSGIDWISEIIGLIAITVIVVGVVKATCIYCFKSRGQFIHVRAELGLHLLLALDFLIAKDIIETFLVPSNSHNWISLLSLGGVVLIRIVMTHFLESEVHHLWEEEKNFFQRIRKK